MRIHMEHFSPTYILHIKNHFVNPFSKFFRIFFKTEKKRCAAYNRAHSKTPGELFLKENP